MNKRLIVTGVLTVAIAATLGMVFFLSALGADKNVCGATDGPPDGAPTPNARQLAEWPLVRDQAIADAIERRERGQIAGSGEVWPPPPEPSPPAGFVEQPWMFVVDEGSGTPPAGPGPTPPPGSGSASGGLIAVVNPCV